MKKQMLFSTFKYWIAGVTALCCVGCANGSDSSSSSPALHSSVTSGDVIHADSSSEEKNSQTNVESVSGEVANTSAETAAADELNVSLRFNDMEKYSMLSTWAVKENIIYNLVDIADSEEMQTYYEISVMDEEGDEWGTISLPIHSYSLMSCNGMCIDEDDQIWLLIANFSQGEEKSTLTSDESTPFHLMCFNQEGEIQKDIILDEAVDIGNGSYTCLLQDEAGNLYAWEQTQQKALIWDGQGTWLGVISLEDGEANCLVRTRSGEIYAVGQEKGRTNFWKLQLDNMSFTQEAIEVGQEGFYFLQEGLDFDILAVQNSKLIEISLEDASVHERLIWNNQGIDGDKIWNISKLDEGSLVLALENSDAKKMELVTLTQEGTAAHPTVITIATMRSDQTSFLEKFVIEFNRTHTDVQIRFNEYHDGSVNSSEEIEDALNRLNADIVAGTAGDILDIQSLHKITSKRYYVEKGALENLYDWIEQDADIQREDFIPNLLETDEVDGGLYDFIFTFAIETFAGKTSLVGDSYAWTWEQAKGLLQQQSDKELFTATEMSREEFLYDVLLYNQHTLVDWDTRSSQFDTEGFASYLEYAKDYLTNQADMEIYIVGNTSIDKAYRGTLLLVEGQIGANMTGYRGLEGNMREPISLIGFPTVDGSGGSVFSPWISLGILSDSTQKEAAWNFFKELLSDESQAQMVRFPVTNVALDTWKQSVIANDTLAMNGFGTIDIEITFGELQQYQVDTVSEFLTQVDKIEEIDQNIYQIVLEEAAYYFADTRTVEETCEMIQSRVSLYLME